MEHVLTGVGIIIALAVYVACMVVIFWCFSRPDIVISLESDKERSDRKELERVSDRLREGRY